MKYFGLTLATLIVASFSFCLTSGCKKKEAAEPTAAPQAAAPSSAPARPAAGGGAAPVSPADAVRAAFERKEYDQVVAGLNQMAASASNDAQKGEYLRLKMEMKDLLEGRARTDPKAAEALMVVRTMTSGR